MSVSIREKRGRLYLDIYKNGQRTWEALHLTLTQDKIQNKEMRKMAEICRAKKEMHLLSGEWNIQDVAAGRVSIAEYALTVAAMPNHSQNVKKCAKKLKAYKNADTQIAAVSAQWIKDFQDYLKTGAGLALSSAWAYMNALRTILNQAVKDRIILKSPAAGVTQIDVPEKEIVFLTVAELRALFACADNPAWKETARAFLFGYYTGLRISDLRSLTWGKINMEPLQIIKRQKKTKQDVVIPLAAPAWAFINDNAEHNPDDKVFMLPSLETTYRRLKEWGKAAGLVKNLTWHIARKTFATQSLESGAEIYTVAKLLGHKGLKQVARYAEATDKLRRAAVDALPEIRL